MNIVAKNIKYLREKNKVSRKELAKQLNRSVSTIQMWEQDLRSPVMGAVLEIADYFGVDVDTLIYTDISTGTTSKSGRTDMTALQLDIQIEVRALSEKQRREVLNYINFIKSQGGEGV